MEENSFNSSLSIEILVEGKDICEKYLCKTIYINKELLKIPFAVIELLDGDPSKSIFEASESKDFKIGKDIEIKIGYENKPKILFKGIIFETSIQLINGGESIFVLNCRDVAVLTTLRRNSMQFKESSDSQAFSKILGKYSSITKEIDSTDIKHEALVQNRISDWDFLCIRSEANGHLVWCDNGKINSKKVSTKKDPVKTFSFGNNIINMQLDLSCKKQLTEVEGIYWNAKDLKVEKIKEDTSTLDSFGEDSTRILSEATKQKKDSIWHSGDLQDNEMKTKNESLLSFYSLSKIFGHITVFGDNEINLTDIIKIEKTSKKFSGDAFVSKIVQKIDLHGWKTELYVGLDYKKYLYKYPDINDLPAAGLISPTTGLSIGIVKKIFGDPEECSRFFVYLPTIHETPDEGIWCRYTSNMAGDQYGVQFFPEVDEEVIVSFIDDDPRHPVILGSMYGKKNKPPKPISEEGSAKCILSKKKLEISLDDKEETILIQIPDSKQSISISKTKNLIEISNGSSSSIKISDKGIDFKSSGNISISSDGNVKISGTAGVTIHSDGDCKIQGMSTQIKGEVSAEIQGSAMCSLKSTGEAVIKGTIVRIN